MNELALFAGIGGGILGSQKHGWQCVCAVEIDPYCRSVLMARQNEGLLLPFPIWDDVCTFDGIPWRRIVDVVSGGFPCQDISSAGKRAGIEGERSGLWSEMHRIVGEVRPRYVFVENVAALLVRGLDRVLADLAALRYDCQWGVLGAADVGAPHQRNRLWLLATDAAGKRLEGAGMPKIHSIVSGDAGTWPIEPDVDRVAYGVPFRVDRLKALGNAQVPQCAAAAIDMLMQ